MALVIRLRLRASLGKSMVSLVVRHEDRDPLSLSTSPSRSPSTRFPIFFQRLLVELHRGIEASRA